MQRCVVSAVVGYAPQALPCTCKRRARAFRNESLPRVTIDDDDVFKVIFVKIFSDLRKFCSTLTRAILLTF